jgi:hypothetical protein
MSAQVLDHNLKAASGGGRAYDEISHSVASHQRSNIAQHDSAVPDRTRDCPAVRLPCDGRPASLN